MILSTEQREPEPHKLQQLAGDLGAVTTMHSIYKGILPPVKQELCHEHLRTYASIIKNERMNSINMLLQFSSDIVR